MKQIKQYRYYGEGSQNNYPNNLSVEQLKSGSLFNGLAISQLGIQGKPNLTFFLNGSDFPIILGETGIYEIDLQDRGVITSIRFVDNNTLKSYDGNGDRLLIDIVFETKGGN